MKPACHQLFSVRTIVGLFLLVTLMGWSALGVISTSTSTSTISTSISIPSLTGLCSFFSSFVCSNQCLGCQITITNNETVINTTTLPSSAETITITVTNTSSGQTVITSTQTVTETSTQTVTGSNVSTFTTFVPDMNGDCSLSVSGTDSATTTYSSTQGPSTVVGVDRRTCIL
jgi:hypothetical protein